MPRVKVNPEVRRLKQEIMHLEIARKWLVKRLSKLEDQVVAESAILDATDFSLKVLTYRLGEIEVVATNTSYCRPYISPSTDGY